MAPFSRQPYQRKTTDVWEAQDHSCIKCTSPACVSFDGPSDNNNNNNVTHPNLASFTFNFAPPDKSKEQLPAPERELIDQPPQELTPDTPQPTRIEPSPQSPPSIGSRFSASTTTAETESPLQPVTRSRAPISEATPVNPDCVFPPKSAKRVIRPDDWWRKDTGSSRVHSQHTVPVREVTSPARTSPPEKVTASASATFTQRLTPETPTSRTNRIPRKPLNPDNPLVPAPLRIRAPSVLTPDQTQRSRNFLKSVQPLPLDPRIVHNRTAAYLKLEGKSPPNSERGSPEESHPDARPLRREWIHPSLLFEEDPDEIGIPDSDVDFSPEQVPPDPLRETSKMSLLHPNTAIAMTEHRREAVRLAKAQEKTVVEKCRRSGQPIPGYTFDELIGKGSFGRVYKGRQSSTNKVVAIKVLDVDEADFQAFGESKDEQIHDFYREIRILRQAQDSGAPNLNQIIEAVPVHSQLWLICDHCPGGSVKTLMRATADRLSEKYIVVVARELAKALQGLHEAGILHRDVKAANVLIHEEGHLQLCDFGVANVLDQRTDKRRTFIGTPHWMPPEIWDDQPEYSDEVDVWEYGITIYECATGMPPNADLRARQQLKTRMRRLKAPISLPEHETFSPSLRSLVEYTLNPDAKSRPAMNAVLEHEYIQNTEDTHPTGSLAQLVQVYYQWLHSGGHRVSLFMPGGAVVSELDDAVITPEDEWNFSTTESFEKRNSALIEIPDTLTELSPTSPTEGEETPKQPKTIALSPPPLREMTNIERQNFEARVQRGADLSHLFDQDKPNYEYKVKKDFVPIVEQRRVSDLPFRAMSDDRPSSIASNVIDLGDFDSEDYAIAAPKREETIQLADAATLRAKRADSKGPRDPAASASLTARRVSSSDDLPSQQVAAQDFAFPSGDAARTALAPNNTSPEADIQTPPGRDTSRKTMEWKFPVAVASSPEAGEELSQDDTSHVAERTAKHATMDWSFSSAMAEASAGSPPHTRTTPKRPAALSRTMTQPITSTEVHHAEELPRPSTSHSEAPSEASLSSIDIDPFVYEHQFPDPDAVDQLNPSRMYATRGHTLAPAHIVPYASTQAGPTPYMMGRSARIGEEGFPGPSVSAGFGSMAVQAMTSHRQRQTSAGSSSSSRSRSGRHVVELPPPLPPSEAGMAGNAPPEVVEGELGRLFSGFQQSLQAAGQVVGNLARRGRKRGAKRGGSGKKNEDGEAGGESEWEDEE